MKKEMKHALVALGLSTLLVPTFANQVVYAQEESHETATSVSPEEVRKVIAEYKKANLEYIEKDKEKLLKLVEQLDWSLVSFSQNDVALVRNKISAHFSRIIREFIDSIDKEEKEILSHIGEWEYRKERFQFREPQNENRNYNLEIKWYIFSTIVEKKKELITAQIKKNPHYTNLEREKMLQYINPNYSWGGPGGPNWLDQYEVYNGKEQLTEFLKRLPTFLSDDFQAFSLAPTEKNIREVNAVAFMEKTAISNDDSLSKADKVSMFSKIDDIVGEAVKKIKTEADIHEDGNYKNSRMLSPEELSVFTKRIEDVYQGKANPKVTKEEAIQAVSTGTSSSVSTSSQSTVTSNEETKKDHQASKWFKEFGKWYYNDLSGNLVRNSWVGRYYLKADASMAASEWIYDKDYKSWFYVDSTGSYVEKAWQGEYYLKRGGYMAKSEWVFDSQYDSWYYLNQDGKYARNQWIKDGDKWYYLLADGKLAKNMTINGYKVNEKGEWV
ncbi:N-acetylmuramoyl-L-alanine amidase family protein [Streptococcus mitis]|jgi:choline binding protein cbp14|uniref:N-acetylmuramoyl-L-alanine amidase family protein n=1 Tax=Streptococcus mitis TaxID=28037 RepID=UPI002001BC02|nr:N-acetylmuramoyl-L-alanine amidase family protein [Streptococcus mitis]